MCGDTTHDTLCLDHCDGEHSRNSDAAEARLRSARAAIAAELQQCALGVGDNDHAEIFHYANTAAAATVDACAEPHDCPDDGRGVGGESGSAHSHAASSTSRLSGVFGAIVTEATARGQLMGAMLVAACGIAHAIHLTSSSIITDGQPGEAVDGAAKTGCKAAHDCTCAVRSEGCVLARLARMYVTLYRHSPVPTRLAWHAAMRETWQTRSSLAGLHGVCGGEQTGVADTVGGAVAAPVTPARLSSSSASVSAAAARQNDSNSEHSQHVVHTGRSHDSSSDGVARGDGGATKCVTDQVSPELLLRGHAWQSCNDRSMGDDVHDDDDGSFTDEKLREFLTCCLRLGRRCARPRERDRAKGATSGGATASLREMLTVVQNYLHSQSMEW